MWAFTPRHLFTSMSLLVMTLWLALIPIPASGTTSPTTRRPDYAAIDAYVRSQMRLLHIPGVALGIVHGTQVTHLQGFGAADPSGRAVTPHTTFAISSMTKAFTAEAVMQLVEQGKVTLDAPVQRYLPWFRVATPGASGQITVRELLNHTAGIPGSAGTAVLNGSSTETMEQAVQTLSAVELYAPPGTAFQYSNIDYVALGLIVQVTSGQSYETYLQQHVFAPLQMRNSVTTLAPAAHRGMAAGYRWWFGQPVPFTFDNPPKDLPAGGIISSAEDMTHFLIAQLNAGMYGGASILSPASMAVLQRPVRFAGITSAPYAMGWYVLPIDGESVLTHTGDNPNYYSAMAVLPQSQWAVVVLSNVNNELAFKTQPYLNAIPAGVIALLLGQSPHVAGLGLRTVFLIVDVVLLGLTLLALWSMLRLIRGWQRPSTGRQAGRLWTLPLPLLWEVALPVGLLIELPQIIGASWQDGLLYLPDISYWLLGMFALLLLTGAARVTRMVWRETRSRRTSSATATIPA